jgi:hypothetical protein
MEQVTLLRRQVVELTAELGRALKEHAGIVERLYY